MACGTAVVASDVGRIAELVAIGRMGLLVRYDEPDAGAHRYRLAESNDRLRGDPTLAAAEPTVATYHRVLAEKVFSS